jgi:hypothetical protein
MSKVSVEVELIFNSPYIPAIISKVELDTLEKLDYIEKEKKEFGI